MGDGVRGFEGCARVCAVRGLMVERRVLSCRWVMVLAVLGALGSGRVAAQEQTTTVILVRHAEKEAEPAADPPLTAEGAARAAALIDAVGDAGISAIFATQYARTKKTAEPIASRLGLQVEALAAGGDLKAYAAGVAGRIRSRHAGQTVLVVGHSNTVPAIVEALGGKASAIQDHEYDHLFIVRIGGAGEAKVVHVRYGAPSVPPAG
jgi:broad specificity phosphatase PhoE